MKFTHYFATIVACLASAAIAGTAGAIWAVTLDAAAIIFILIGDRQRDKE